MRAVPTITLQAGREKSLLQRHPWVFASAVARVEGSPQDGETARVVSAAGEFLGWGAYSSQSQIRLRMWSWREDDEIGPAFFAARIQQALSLRERFLAGETDAYRLVHGESDGLPGLIVDRYGGLLVMQCLSCGAERWRDELAEAVSALAGVEDVFERSDADVRRLEGLPWRVGKLKGAEPAGLVWIQENGLRCGVDVREGHKTGFYLDQRLNRAAVRQLAHGKNVLDCFCYTGGFTLAALAGGARQVTAVDSSAPALALAEQNLAANFGAAANVEWLEGDVFRLLRLFRDQGRHFDMVILDPPRLAPTAAHAERAARAYKDLNLLAFKLLVDGGTLVTFSCSGGVSADLFQKIAAGAALDAGVQARIVQRLAQGVDHPVALNFPEGAYLKGLVIAVDR